MHECVQQVLVTRPGRIAMCLSECRVPGEAFSLFASVGEFMVAIGQLERAEVELETFGDRTAIATAVDLVNRFVTMVKDQMADALDDWLREAEDGARALASAGLRRDENVVRAALTEPWSNGQVEGQVNRLKVIKREMYGRAGFDLLRCRFLGHA